MNELDELKAKVNACVTKVDIHDILLRGDPENMKESPGVMADHQRLSYELGRTNEILTEVRDSLSKINWLLISAFFVGLVALVFKTIPAL